MSDYFVALVLRVTRPHATLHVMPHNAAESERFEIGIVLGFEGVVGDEGPYVRVWRVVTGCCGLTAQCSCGCCSGAGIRQCGAVVITRIPLPTQLSVAQLSVVVVVLLLDRPKKDVGCPRQILMNLTGIAPNVPYFNSSGYVHGNW